ncbi:hypothetical protein [Nonomuraea sp. bgisy101]|uniref:hypothetical protein n=1 Tax=Nonomuraea sp. bgisy101 TaxID=3413784 RepID=UPI003D704BF7
MENTQYLEDIDEFLDGYTVPETEVPIVMRGDLQLRFEELERRLEAARRAPAADSLVGNGGEVRNLAEQIETVRQEMQAHVRVFKLRALGKKAWSDLAAKHPPRKEDLPADHNRETFPLAALVACSVKPQLTTEKAEKLVELITQGQWNALWNAILGLNGDSGAVPFSAAASAILSGTRTS